MKRLLIIYLPFIFLWISCENKKQQNVYSNSIDSSKSPNNIVQNNFVLDDYKIHPTDESNKDSSLITFVKNLKLIVSRKDTAALFSTLDTTIIVSHGGGIYGIKGFSQKWQLHQHNEESKLWEILSRLLSMGGTWENDIDGEYFCIPYTQSNKAFSNFKYDFDWYQTAVCTSPNASVYETPSITSIEIATLNYNIVEIDPMFMQPEFTKIHTIDKTVQGYIKTDELMYSSDPHLILKKINHKWFITAFAPFD